jgi:hypothetical protein
VTPSDNDFEYLPFEDSRLPIGIPMLPSRKPSFEGPSSKEDLVFMQIENEVVGRKAKASCK